MCRMLYMETEFPRKSAMKLAKFALNYWSYTNRDGTGLAFIAKDGSVQIQKTKDSPKAMFKRNNIPRVRRLAGHVRAGTAGGVCDMNAHPFVSCDGRSAFMHNGVLQNWQGLQERLIKKGHKFTSKNVDSEVMLHLAEEVGPEKLMEALNKEEITGYANWIWMTPEKTFAFSDGSLVLVRDELGLQVALFSDVDWAEKKFFKKRKNLPRGTLVTIENGKHTSKNGIKSIERWGKNPWGIGLDFGKWETYNSRLSAAMKPGKDNDDLWEAMRRSVPEELPNFHVKPQTGRFSCRHGVPYRVSCRKCDKKYQAVREAEPIQIIRSDGKRTLEATWFAPGDLFCKRCNVVYSDPTATGQCSICYGRLLDVSAL